MSNDPKDAVVDISKLRKSETKIPITEVVKQFVNAYENQYRMKRTLSDDELALIYKAYKFYILGNL